MSIAEQIVFLSQFINLLAFPVIHKVNETFKSSDDSITSDKKMLFEIFDDFIVTVAYNPSKRIPNVNVSPREINKIDILGIRDKCWNWPDHQRTFRRNLNLAMYCICLNQETLCCLTIIVLCHCYAS